MIDKTEQEIMKNWKKVDDVPLVSICTITYKQEKYIAETLDGLLMQETDFPFDIVVDDDCSPDNTADIIKKYMNRFPNIMNVRFREKNVGYIINTEGNMTRAKGKYIALCEGDDFWTDPQKLQIQVDFLEKNRDYIISGHDAYSVDENGRRLNDSKLPDSSKKDKSGEDLIKGNAFIPTISMVFRNIIPKKFPEEFRNVLNGDTFLVSMLGHYGNSKYHPEIKPAGYRTRADALWSKQSEKERLNARRNYYFWIYRYYRRIGEEKYAGHYWSLYEKKVLEGLNSKILVGELLNRGVLSIKKALKSLRSEKKF
jgi:glycosyltransferase involved in cell wall biosynthesis